MINYVDYHNHTVVCHHATGTVDQYLERAKELGIREYGFAEHSHWMIKSGSRVVSPTEEEFQQYYQWMQERKDLYNGKNGYPKLRVGIEADWVPERLDEARKFIANHSFDFVYGSVHHLPDPLDENNVLVWKFQSDNVEEMYRRYFAAIGDLAESGLCDILAHIDVIRRSCKIPAAGVLSYVEEILPRIVKSGVAIEINASGKDHPNGGFFPQKDVLKMLIQAGVPVTFGSDGHTVEHVGRYASEVVEYFKECGGKEYMRFENRQKIPTPID